jgi:hypothetical protein
VNCLEAGKGEVEAQSGTRRSDCHALIGRCELPFNPRLECHQGTGKHLIPVYTLRIIMAENADGPRFRANKRRKVFRKRAESGTNDDDEPQLARLQPSGLVSAADVDNITGVGNEDSTSRSDVSRVRKPKKHGIAFSSLDRPSLRPHNDNEETAMVISEPQAAEQENGRFTKQTGKAIVEDDKHMCVSATQRATSYNFLKAGLTA